MPLAETFEELARQMARPAPYDRFLAALALGRLRDPRAVPLLVGALADASTTVREAAATALGDRADPQAAEALAGALTDPQPSVRYLAARALGQIGAAPAAGPLAHALGDTSYQVRHAAAEALGALGASGGAALPALRAAARDPESQVQWAAQRAIARIEAALQVCPAELEASAPPAGRGTEPEASEVPEERRAVCPTVEYPQVS